MGVEAWAEACRHTPNRTSVCLQAKSPIIEVLEERLMKAAELRGSAAAAATDGRDMYELEAAQVEDPVLVCSVV